MSNVSQWGLYPWFGDEPNLVHPDDVDAFKAFRPYSRVLHCVSEDADYLTLRHGEFTFRVKPDLFMPVPPPRYTVGQGVRTRRHGEIVTVTICDIVWHYSRQRPYYYVIVNGKRSSKWYWEEDFEIGSDANS